MPFKKLFSKMAYITIFLKVFKGLLFFQYKCFIIYKDFIEQTKSILLNLLCFVYNKLETVLYVILFFNYTMYYNYFFNYLLCAKT